MGFLRKNEEFDFYSRTNLKAYNLDGKIRYQLKMLDGLDAFTRRHSENVANVTCRLCEYLNMDEGFTIYTTTCAYLHDIGKMFIPPAILQKPTKLTEEEFEVMKTHTTIGYKMCMDDPQLRPYAAGPLFHHEALNGKGYPNGVKGQKIPYEGQIIRVADEYDAITAKRQYKSHVGIIQTLEILIDETRPTNNAVEDLNLLREEARMGKIDKRILKCLFRVVLDDTEYEIATRSDYLDFIKQELRRLKPAEPYYNRMIKATNEKKKDYYRQGVQMYLTGQEKPEELMQEIQELKDAYETRREHLKKLEKERSSIRHLTV